MMQRLYSTDQYERQAGDFYPTPAWTDKGDSPQHDHCWLVWDWSRDPAKLPFDVSAGDPRLKGCRVCGGSLAHLRTGAKTCSVRCRAALSRRKVRAQSLESLAPPARPARPRARRS